MTQAKKPSDGKRLREIYDALPQEQQKQLLAFAEFLQTQTVDVPKDIPAPKDIPRPDNESVIKATRRLSETYFMIDKSKMLNDTSTLMAQHVMQGRDAKEVIDDLEAAFERAYKKLVNSDGE